MRIKYTGGRTWIEIVLNRKSYYFTKENDRILDITDQAVINYIFSLPNRAEFEVMVEPQEIIFDDKNNTVTTVEEGLKIEPKIEELKIIKKVGRPKKLNVTLK